MKVSTTNQVPIAIIIGFIFLLASLYIIINPNVPIHPIFFIAAEIFILYPFRHETLARRLMQLGIITLLIWLPLNLAGVLFPFIFALIFAYLCRPLVDFLQRKGLPRWLSSLLIISVILGSLTLFFVFVIPTIVEQFNQLVAQMQVLVENTNYKTELGKVKKMLMNLGVPQKQIDDVITKHIEPTLKDIANWLFSRFGSLLKNITGILEGVMNAVLIPLLSFYILNDFDKLEKFTREKLVSRSKGALKYIMQIDDIFSSYIRGILLTSSMVGAVTSIILSLFGTPFAIVIGLLTGVFNLIPSVGMLINIAVAALVYLFTPGDFLTNIVITASVIIGLHAVNAYFVEPKIIGKKLGLHPVILLASLFVASHFLGFVGLLIAVPLAAVIVYFLSEWWKYREEKVNEGKMNEGKGSLV